MAPVVLVWLVTLGACSAARRAPVLEAEVLEAEQESLAADAAEVRPSVENAPEQQPTAPSLPPLEPMLVTQLDEQPRVSDLDAARLSLLMSQPIPIRELLLLLVRDTWISIVPDPNVEGSFVGELKDVTVRQAIELSLTPLGLDYAVEGGVVRVFERRRNTRIFQLDYVATRRTVRRTLVDGSADEQASSTVATAVDQTDLFAAVSSGVAALLSPDGRFTVDRQAAMVQVIDYPDNLAGVERYLDRVRVRAHRQVHVQAHLIEVEIGGRTAVDGPAALVAAGVAPRSGARARVTRLGALANAGLESLLDALGEQGTATVLSSPGVVTLNNEPALLSSRSERGTPADRLEVVLAVTPQIGAEGDITLSVSPRATFASAQEESLVAREADTLVRLRDGETVALSGWLGSLPVPPSGEGGTPRRADLLILLTPTVLVGS